MRTLITFACIFLSLQRNLANKKIFLKDSWSEDSSESSDSSSSSPSSSFIFSLPSSSSSCSSSSPSSSSDSSSSSSCKDSSGETFMPIKLPPAIIPPMPYPLQKRLYTKENIRTMIYRTGKIQSGYPSVLKDSSSKESSDSKSSSLPSSSFSTSSSSSSDSSSCSSCEDSLPSSTSPSFSSSSESSSSSSCNDSLPSSSSFSSSSFSSSSSDSSSSSSCEDSSSYPSSSSSSSSSSSDSSSSSSYEDSLPSSSSPSSSSSFESSSSSSCEDSSSSSSSSSSPSSSDSSSSSFSEELSVEILWPILCPVKTSFHTEDDIKIMIDYIARTLSVYPSINNSYYSRAIAVRDKHMDDFEQFRDWFQDRPEHLKHVLEDLAYNRLYIEPSVKNVALILNEYSQLEENFNKKMNRTNKLLKKLNSYRIICEHNCEISQLDGIETNYRQKGYFCSSLEDLHRNIHSKLTLFVKKMSTTMQDQITYDDNVFADNIGLLKNKLKDVALKEFGQTMYDILNLQDEYHHFIEDITKINAISHLYDIKETSLLIDTKLLEFERRIEKYGNDCRSCSANVLRSTPQNSESAQKENKQKKKNILDHLLNHKFTQIESFINKDYEGIFQELNSLLNNTDSEDVLSNDLKPIQNDVIEILQNEKVHLNELKNIVPRSSITKFINLSDISQQLLSMIIEEINNINQ